MASPSIIRQLTVTDRIPAVNGSTTIKVPTGAAGLEVETVDIALRKTDASTYWTDANIDSYLSGVKVRLDGQPIIDVLGSEWMDLMGYYRSITADKGIVPIRFANLVGRTEDDEDAPAFGTLNVGSLEIELVWASSFGALTALQVNASMTGRPNRELGAFTSWRRQTPSVNGTSNVTTDLGTLRNDEFLGAIHIKNANITRSQVRVGNLVAAEELAVFQAHKSRENGLNPNAAWTHLDIARSRRRGDFLQGGGSVVLNQDYGTDPAGSVVHILQVAETYRGG